MSFEGFVSFCDITSPAPQWSIATGAISARLRKAAACESSPRRLARPGRRRLRFLKRAHSCRRRLSDKSGDGLMRRLAHGPDAKKILREALDEAAKDAGVVFEVRDGEMFLNDSH